MIEFWKNLFKDSWSIYTENIRLIMGSFILILLPAFILMLLPISTPADNINSNRLWESFFQSLSFSEIFLIFSIQILMTGIYIGMLNIFYKITAGYPASLKQLLSKFYCLPRVILPDLIIGVIMFIAGVSTFTMIINVVYRLIFFYYNLVIVVEDTSILKSINKSFSLVKNSIGLIMQFMIVLIGMGMVGLFFPILFFGLIPFWTILYIQIYLKVCSEIWK